MAIVMCGMCDEEIPPEDEVEYIETKEKGEVFNLPYCEDCAWQVKIKNGDVVE